MSKFNNVIKDYIKEQVMGINVDSLPKKFAGLNNSTNKKREILNNIKLKHYKLIKINSY